MTNLAQVLQGVHGNDDLSDTNREEKDVGRCPVKLPLEKSTKYTLRISVHSCNHVSRPFVQNFCATMYPALLLKISVHSCNQLYLPFTQNFCPFCDPFIRISVKSTKMYLYLLENNYFLCCYLLKIGNIGSKHITKFK